MTSPDLSTFFVTVRRAEAQFRRLSATELHELPSPVVEGVNLLYQAMTELREQQVIADGNDAGNECEV